MSEPQPWAWLPPDDARRLEAFLRSLGGSDAEIDAAARTGTAGALALDLALRDGRPPVAAADVAARIGEDLDRFGRFQQALGFSDPPTAEAPMPGALADALPVVATATSAYLGEQTAIGLARVIGSAGARLAEAVVDAFRVDFELPQLGAGTSYADVVEGYVRLTRESLPALESVITAVFRAHLLRVAAGAWAPDDDRAAARRDLFVGFADLVGYTALARTMTPAQLAALLDGFEGTVSDTVASRGGRLVKLVGDGAMFVAEDVEAGCAMSLDLAARADAAPGSPPVRIGAACGAVITRYGDYFGDVVNLAARLVALARPSTVVVSEVVAAAAGRSFGFDRLPPQALKGFDAPAVTYRLVGPTAVA